MVDHGSLPKRPRFPQKSHYSIAATSTRNAYPNGEINVSHMVQSHTSEIKLVEQAIKAAKHSLTRRAFQDVPRELRRRTASHNPQRVPKRLQARLRQEMKDDNTPISRGMGGSGVGKGKTKSLRRAGAEKSRQLWEQRTKRRKEKSFSGIPGVSRIADTLIARVLSEETGDRSNQRKGRQRVPPLATPATPSSQFRKRQRNKSWLPTHLWHTKRARMTKPSEPLWGFAIPLQPVVKNYRLIHRAAAERGAVAWDASYMSTIGLEGREAGIVQLLQSLHFAADSSEDPWQDSGRAKKWRLGTRSWDGWVFESQEKPARKIARVTVVWCVSKQPMSTRQVFVRVHPSAFIALWNHVTRIAMIQKPFLLVQDLRFEIGSIEMVGPSCAETLTSILIPSPTQEKKADGSPEELWHRLSSVTNVASLPAGALLAFDIMDPRLYEPMSSDRASDNQDRLDALTEVLSSWPIDSTQNASSLFNRDARCTAARAMPSQKSINRRKSAQTLGGHPQPKSTDARIPMMTYTCRDENSWTVLLPWKCVLAVWRGIMRYPLSTGGNPRFGGLKQRRQVRLERQLPTFPCDFPGTDAGWAWELGERTGRKVDWAERPKGKRIEWTTIDLGNGKRGEIGEPWACVWERFLPNDNSKVGLEKAPGLKTPLAQLPQHAAKELAIARSRNDKEKQDICLATVRITMVGQGTMTECARIYRLPRNDSALQANWLALLQQKGRKDLGTSQVGRDVGDPPTPMRYRPTPGSLKPSKQAKTAAANGELCYPAVPDDDDLIGFVTTGNYNLGQGMASGVGTVIIEQATATATVKKGGQAAEEHICIIRPAGRTIGRLARWQIL